MLALQGAPTCWFSEVKLSDDTVSERGESSSQSMAPASTLLALQRIIQQRKEDRSGAILLLLFQSTSCRRGLGEGLK